MLSSPLSVERMGKQRSMECWRACCCCTMERSSGSVEPHCAALYCTVLSTHYSVLTTVSAVLLASATVRMLNDFANCIHSGREVGIQPNDRRQQHTAAHTAQCTYDTPATHHTTPHHTTQHHNTTTTTHHNMARCSRLPVAVAASLRLSSPSLSTSTHSSRRVLHCLLAPPFASSRATSLHLRQSTFRMRPSTRTV